MKQTLSKLVLTFIISIVFVSCSMASLFSTNPYGKLSIEFRSSDDSMTEHDIKLTASSSIAGEIVSTAGWIGTTLDLPPGEWNIEVSVTDSENKLVGVGVEEVAIESGQDMSTSILVENVTDEETSTIFTPSTPPEGWPNAANSGITIDAEQLITDTSSLTESGSGYLITDGMIVENLELTGRLIVNGDNIIIRNCRLWGDSTNHGYGIEVKSGTNILIENNTIGKDPMNWPNNQKGIILRSSEDVTIRGNYIRFVEDGIFMGTTSTPSGITGLTIVDNYITYVHAGHEDEPIDSVHNRKGDGIEGLGPISGTEIRHNSFDAPLNQTSCILISPQWGDVSNLDVSDNWFNGAGYSLRLRASTYVFEEVTVTSNIMGSDSTFGPFNADIIFDQLSDNTWEETGLPVENMNQ